MTIFNIAAVIKKINDKRVFVADAANSVAKQAAIIANTQEKIASLTMAQSIDGNLVDMGDMVESIFTRADKKITASDRAVFAFFNVPLKNTARVIKQDTMEDLLEAKKARLDRDSELTTQYNAELNDQRDLLATIESNKAKAENELAETLENLPDNAAAMLHSTAKAICEVYGQTLSLEYDDVLRRVESSFFQFAKKEGKRVDLKADLDGLKVLANLLSSMKRIETINSGMGVEQRAALFEVFDKVNSELKLFNAGELPDIQVMPVQAPSGFSGEAAHAVPKEPVFNSLSSFFNDVEGGLVVNCVEGVDVINTLVECEDENREYSMLKCVKMYRKNPQAALIETIDNFDLILQGYLNVAMQQFVNDGELSQLDRLYSSPTMVNAGQLTPYGRQVKAYIACVLPYVTLKHRGEGDKKVYFFEPVKFNRLSKLGLSEDVGFYAFGARSKSEKDGQMRDARLPVICIRSHYRISKVLRDLKRADDARIKEAHAREWADYRLKYGAEYTRHTLQAEIDSLKAALAAKATELANHG